MGVGVGYCSTVGSSPLFELDAGVAGQDGMELEVLVVAFWEVVAEVGAAAFGAGEG